MEGHLSTPYPLLTPVETEFLRRGENSTKWRFLFCEKCAILPPSSQRKETKMKRTKLSDRQLPDYSRGEEIMNMVTHIVGGAVGVVALTLCVIFAALHANPWGVVTSAIYGSAMVTIATGGVHSNMASTSGRETGEHLTREIFLRRWLSWTIARRMSLRVNSLLFIRREPGVSRSMACGCLLLPSTRASRSTIRL